jgi:hypothetical protein
MNGLSFERATMQFRIVSPMNRRQTRSGYLMKKALSLVVVAFLVSLAGCASWVPTMGSKQVASTVDYLYPNAKEAPQM